MMCIIRIVDGKPFEHPIMLDNFQEAFPTIDLNNPLPQGYAWFERKNMPEIDMENETFVSTSSEYEFDGTVWTDVWKVRDLNAEEKRANIVNLYNNYKKFLLEEIARAQAQQNTVDVAVWQAEYDKVDAASKQEPLQFQLFAPPRRDENGNWVSVRASGRAPDVIG